MTVSTDSPTVHDLDDSDGAIRLLHRQIEALASRAATAYVVQAPLRVEDRGGFPCCIWYESPELSVISLDGTVGIEMGERFSYHPDATYLCARDQARAVAQALLSASAYVDTHPHNDGTAPALGGDTEHAADRRS
ncbi:hypothetical protein [Gordonia malaquae]|uniref:hypothetical protein n=1 Tax=Gordonia malaquae TaxID=410332 RepID=UPI0030182C28